MPNSHPQATKLDTIVKSVGTQAKPLLNPRFVGVKFTGSAIQFLNPHGVPSGGDWALQRDAALFFEGTVGLNVTGCTFERLDGNALMLSGYTRGALIAENGGSHFRRNHVPGAVRVLDGCRG